MAKYETPLSGNFGELLDRIHNGVLKGSVSASFEDGSDYQCGDVQCAVRVYERYSMVGSNRVSMSVTLVGHGNDLFVSAITSGGSQAVFFKINTIGEGSFLNCVVEIIETYKNGG